MTPPNQEQIKIILDMVEAMVRPALFFDRRGVVVGANTSFYELFGYSKEDLCGQSIYSMDHGAWKFGALLESVLPGEDAAPGPHGMECQLLLPTEEYVSLWVVISPIHMASSGPYYLMALDDITELASARLKLEENEYQIKSLTARLALAEENERREIARDLHDGLCQTLVHLMRKLRAIKQQKNIRPDDIESCLGIAEKSVEEARSLIFEISPPILYDLGLVPAIVWTADELMRDTQLAIRVQAGDDLPVLSIQCKVILYRVVRELLLNASKHAPESLVDVCIESKEGGVAIEVKDDGPGFNIQDLGHRHDGTRGFGLESARDQIASLGGTFEVSSALGKGAVVALWIPDIAVGESQSHA